MRDDQWNEAYNAGRREASEGLVSAMANLIDALEHGIMEEPENYVVSLAAARTALAKYRNISVDTAPTLS